jgi:hypothetical protein
VRVLTVTGPIDDAEKNRIVTSSQKSLIAIDGLQRFTSNAVINL